MSNANWVSKQVSMFEQYLDREIDILKLEGMSYYIAYEFLETIVKRIKMYIGQNASNHPPEIPEKWPEEYRQKWLLENKDYLSRVENIFEMYSRRWEPMDGSFWEDVNRRF